MNNSINKLNVVIAELNLAVAQLAAGAAPSSLTDLLNQAKLDLAAATKSIIGQNPIDGDQTQPQA